MTGLYRCCRSVPSSARTQLFKDIRSFLGGALGLTRMGTCPDFYSLNLESFTYVNICFTYINMFYVFLKGRSNALFLENIPGSLEDFDFVTKCVTHQRT